MAYDLTARLRLKDRFSKPLKNVTKKVNDTDSRMQKMNDTLSKYTKIAAGVAAAGIATVGTVAVRAGLQHEEAFKTIRVGTGATGDQLDELMQTYKNVGSQVPQDLGQVAQATADLNTLTGATGGNLETMTKAVLDASRAMGEDGVTNANALGKALNQWQIPAEKGEETAAKLFKVAQNTGVGFGALAGHMSEYGSVLQNAGFSADESADLFGNLEKSGISVSRIMPGLNMAFRNWAGEGKNAQEEFANTIKRMQEAEDSTKALGIATDSFGAEGAQRLTTAIRNGVISLDDLGKGLDGSIDDMQAAADESLTFGERFSILGNNASLALAPIGEVLLDLAEKYMPLMTDKAAELAEYIENNMPMIRDKFTEFGDKATEAIQFVVDKATEFYNFIQDNWTIIKPTIIGLVGSLILLKGALVAMSVIQTITKMWQGLRAALVVVRTSQLLLNAAMLANPIGIVIALIAGLVAAGIWLYKNWETVREKVGDLWDGIKSAWNSIEESTKRVWYNVKQAIVDAINGIISMINSMINTINKIPGVNVPIVPKVSDPEMPKSMALSDSGGLSSPAAWQGYDGSHRSGLDRVPYDGYVAELHRDEAVLPRQEAQEYRQNKGQGGQKGGKWFEINIANMNVRQESDIDAIARVIAREINAKGV